MFRIGLFNNILIIILAFIPAFTVNQLKKLNFSTDFVITLALPGLTAESIIYHLTGGVNLLD